MKSFREFARPRRASALRAVIFIGCLVAPLSSRADLNPIPIGGGVSCTAPNQSCTLLGTRGTCLSSTCIRSVPSGSDGGTSQMEYACLRCVQNDSDSGVPIGGQSGTGNAGRAAPAGSGTGGAGQAGKPGTAGATAGGVGGGGQPGPSNPATIAGTSAPKPPTLEAGKTGSSGAGERDSQGRTREHGGDPSDAGTTLGFTQQDKSGCSTAPGSPAPGAASWAILLGLAWLRRRRRA